MSPTDEAALALFFVGGIAAFVAIYRRSADISAKFSAVFFIVGVALISKNAWVYALTIFIIATLITELEFLENLAAIFLNRSWWRVRNATSAEVQSKLRAEAVSQELAASLAPPRAADRTVVLGPPGSGKTSEFVNKWINDALLFENQVFERIQTAELFVPTARIRRNLVFQNVRTKSICVVDGVVEQSDRIYVIEIKSSIDTSPRTIREVQSIVAIVGEVWEERRRESRDVFGILIIPGGAESPMFPAVNVAVFVFDARDEMFVNENGIRSWLRQD